MSRVLKPGGIAIITVPGDLRPNFMKVIKYSLYKNSGEMYAIKPSEVAFICIK